MKKTTSSFLSRSAPLSLVLCFVLTFGLSAQAGLLLNYSQLALKDLDQMVKLIKGKIAESQKAGGNKVIPLKEALQAVYSRSNEDFMIEKILPLVKAEMEEQNAWEKSHQALVKEAIGALKNPKAFTPVVQVTYWVFLENVIAEMKPRLDERFESKLITQIRDAKIEMSKEAVNERRLRVMKGSSSPSEIAAGVIKDWEEAQKNPPPEAPVGKTAPPAQKK
jgi:hypothetical protein